MHYEKSCMLYSMGRAVDVLQDDGPKHLAEKMRVNILFKGAMVTGFLLQHEKFFLAQTTQLHGLYN